MRLYVNSTNGDATCGRVLFAADTSTRRGVEPVARPSEPSATQRLRTLRHKSALEQLSTKLTPTVKR